MRIFGLAGEMVLWDGAFRSLSYNRKKSITNILNPMNFFDHHGIIVLLGLALFPRITLLVASFATGGFFWWVGYIFTPHILVAILSLKYWHTNPVLVIVACLWSLVGTGGEGECVNRKVNKNP
jgi:hypothetical protein